MLPVLKTKKETGPLKNLRPVNLLSSIRKTFSIITLNRMKDKVDDNLPVSQTAYRWVNSTGDIISTHKIIAVKAQTNQDVKVHMTGTDMSLSFDECRIVGDYSVTTQSTYNLETSQKMIWRCKDKCWISTRWCNQWNLLKYCFREQPKITKRTEIKYCYQTLVL